MIDRRHIVTAALTALVPLPAAAAEPVIVPLHFDDEGRPYVLATFNGHGPYNLVLSTGTAFYTLQSDLADEAGLKAGGLWQSLMGVATYGPAIAPDAINYRADEVVFEGGYRLTRVNIFSCEPPLHPQPDVFRRNGTVGTEFITSAPCRIDFVKAQIAFYPKGGLPVDDMKKVDDTRRYNSDYAFSATDIVMQSDGDNFSCIMDTASKFDLYFPSEVTRISTSYAGMDPHKYISLPFDKDHPERGTVRIVRRSGFSVAGAKFDVINAALGDPGMKDGLENSYVYAVVGGSLLCQFDIAFDGKGGVYMKPNANFKPVSDPIKPEH